MTPGIASLVEQHQLSVFEFLMRHQCGDWGDLDKEDIKANEDALKYGLRLLSAYHFQPDPDSDFKIKLWVITEADRSVTTVLLPSEY